MSPTSGAKTLSTDDQKVEDELDASQEPLPRDERSGRISMTTPRPRHVPQTGDQTEVMSHSDVEEELEGGFPLGAGRVSTMPPPPMVTQDSDETIVGSGGATSSSEMDASERYRGRGVLGEGGMGEVRLYRDVHVGREVAMKVLLPEFADNETKRMRFLREARIQGQLDHPCVVPVHDIGETRGGIPYFTMKRVRGHTLSSILYRRRRGHLRTMEEFPVKRLLHAFAQVCLAVDYAHSRGVIHRDLKPSNIMVGDFGEVYVLDWGIARVLGAADGGHLDTREIMDLQTMSGSLLGTPGYLAPEQIRGDDLDGRADVFALGAILFEVLSGHALIPEAEAHVMLTDTLHDLDVHGRYKTLEEPNPVSHFMLEICGLATAPNREERFGTARELHAAVQSFLDGDQWDQGRKTAAMRHAAAAERAAQRAYEGQADASKAHSEAMRRAGMAVALDPDSEVARRTLVELIAKPPAKLPPEARRALEHRRDGVRRAGMRFLALGRYAWLLNAPLWVWVGFDNIKLGILITAVAMIAGAVQSWASLQRPVPMSVLRFAAVVQILSIIPVGLVLGPYFLLPVIVVASAPAVVLNLDGIGRRFVLAASVFAIVIPGILEWMGLFPASYSVVGDAIQVSSPVFSFDEVSLRVFMMVSCVLAALISVRMVGGIHDRLTKADEDLYRQRWLLQQLLPSDDESDRP
ncbi:MAG: serine/threonine protein kinase [Deltaproteobacteria bacterium]|nr:serine/threonine protein kinase [Deltaproteobacteria bacterium]